MSTTPSLPSLEQRIEALEQLTQLQAAAGGAEQLFPAGYAVGPKGEVVQPGLDELKAELVQLRERLENLRYATQTYELWLPTQEPLVLNEWVYPHQLAVYAPAGGCYMHVAFKVLITKVWSEDGTASGGILAALNVYDSPGLGNISNNEFMGEGQAPDVDFILTLEADELAVHETVGEFNPDHGETTFQGIGAGAVVWCPPGWHWLIVSYIASRCTAIAQLARLTATVLAKT
jgi:hypothetical protein